MTMKVLYAAVFLLLMLTFFWGCDYKGDKLPPENPFVQIYGVPPDSSCLGAAPIIYWWGTDRDGIIKAYEYIDIPRSKVSAELYASLVDDYKTSPNIPDSVLLIDGVARWFLTEANVDTIYLSLEQGEDTTEHLFCVRSIDNEDFVSDEECMIYFRTNQPPDTIELSEFENYPEGDTFWVLNDLTDDWDGIPFSWRAHDPDNSVILEYYWWVELFDNPDSVCRTSLSEDSLGGIYSGTDSLDGWVRSTKTVLKGVDTGHWRFIIKVRDDAFYEGAQDTFEFYSVHPYFDPSDTNTIRQMYEGTFDHRLLFIYDNRMITGWENQMWTDFYQPILEQMKNRGYFYEYTDTAAITMGENLTIGKWTLKDYSIIYFYHLGGLIYLGVTQSPSPDMLDELRDYVMAGGRVIFDGRGFFMQTGDENNAFSPYGTIQFDMFGITWHGERQKGLLWSSASHPEYTDLYVDQTKVSDTVITCSAIGLYPYFYGVPFTEILYNVGYYETDDSVANAEFIGLPIATRFAKTTTRTAIFSFPLYAMDNSEGQVTAALDSTFSFVVKAFEPESDEENGFFRIW